MDPSERYHFPIPGFKTETDRITTLLLGVNLLIFLAVVISAEDRLTGALAVLAASGAGAFLGLLFAIPKRVTVPDDQFSRAEGRDRGALVANTSLEEVSDWLTKTIVGVGLVSWSSILARLDTAGEAVGRAVTGSDETALASGVAIIIAASAHGGMCAYLWFSRHLPGEFKDAFTFSSRKTDAQGLAQKHADVAPATPTAPLVSDAPEKAHDAASAAQTSAAELQQAVEAKYARMREAPIDIEDWALGMFSGDSSVTNEFGTRTLGANVRRVAKGAYSVTLTVTANPVPDGPCVFFLHNTFPNSTPAVGFDSGGKATLTVTAWGAFTVGALIDDGTTELELNLAQLPGVPKEFRDG